MSEFDKEKAIRLHHELLLGTFFSRLVIDNDSIEVFSNIENEPSWEYVLPFSENIPEDSRNIYTTKILPQRSLQFTDSWLVSALEKEEAPDSLAFIRVDSKAKMLKFLQTLYQAYSSHSPNDPYGSLPPGYHPALLKAFETGKSKLHFIYIQDTFKDLVGTSALAIHPPYAFLYCVGITPPWRNRGLSEQLLQYQKYYAHSQGCSFLIAQTLKASFVENLYLKNHFERVVEMHFYGTA